MLMPKVDKMTLIMKIVTVLSMLTLGVVSIICNERKLSSSEASSCL